MMRRPPVLLLVSMLMLAAACTDSGGGDTPAADPTTPPEATTEPTEPASGEVPVATGKLAGVTVTEGSGPGPKVEIAAPFSVAETTAQVLAEGDGRAIEEGDQVTVAYVLANGASGTVLDSTYEREQPQVFQMQDGGILPGLYAGLLGQTAGSRVALAVPPAAAFGPEGSPQFGVQPNETLVFVLDIEGVTDLPEMAEGQPRAAPDDLPRLRVDASGEPQRFVAEGDEPAELKEVVAAPIIVGDGPRVQPGQTLTVHYLGQLYPDGEVFDESWSTGQPFGFQLGTNGVIPGWDQGLDGQRVGSRVVLAIPSDLAYGEAGQPPAIGPNADLIFSVDILAAG